MSITHRIAASAVAFFGAVVVVGLIVGGVRLTASPIFATAATPHWRPAFDEALKRSFAENHRGTEAPYDDAFVYFVTAFHDRERRGGSRADNPGASSRHGKDIDAFESFARLAPMIATWIASGRAETITDLHGESVDLRRLVRDGIVSGTTRGQPSYWGDMQNLDQRIVEAADIARTVWILRQLNLFSAEQLHKVSIWLEQVDGKRVPDNNWHLYPVLIGEVLKGLGQPYDQADIDANWKRFLTFYRGDGWFSDGPGTNFDFYNAWAIEYELFWLRRISPRFGGRLIDAAMRTFLSTYPYFLSTNGIPIMGRSVCYRMAAPTPLVAAALPSTETDEPRIDPGLARHSLDAVWSYFVSQGAVAEGVPTQGYCGVDLRVLDNYSGPASCLWALRSIILAFMAPREAPFWTAPPKPLPIERGNYRIALAAIGRTIEGTAATRDVRIIRDAAYSPSGEGATTPALAAYGPLRQAATALLWRPFRPDNRAAKYEAPVYSSAHPFCGCSNTQTMLDAKFGVAAQ